MSPLEIVFAALGVLVTIVASFATYAVARRQYAGKIENSDAATIWAESNALRKEWRDRATLLENEFKNVSTQLQDVLDELAKIKASNASMKRKIASLKHTISTLREHNQQLLSRLDQEDINEKLRTT